MRFMRSALYSLVVGSMLSSTVMASDADDFTFNTKSLIGVEGGYSSFTVDNNLNTINPFSYVDPTTRYSNPEIGLKIGAQGDDFRVFISARSYFIGSEFDYLVTAGAEAQYLFNFSKAANFFIGVNAGYLSTKIKVKDEDFTRTFGDMYYGGDLGFNFHVNETFDFEIGARVMSTNADSNSGGVIYSLDYISTGYASLIVKFTMD